MTSTETEKSDLIARPPILASSFATLRPDRFDHIFLYYESDFEHYRYRLTVIDRSLLPTTRLQYATAVVLIPAGRETEYMFSSARGLRAVADSAQCARLVAVAFGRHYTFETQQQVQAELTYVVQVVAQQGKFLPPAQYKHYNPSIPFMALDGVGSRNVLEEGNTTLSGAYVVEQIKAEDRLMRRLYFMDNPFVIQSEVAMTKNGTDDDEASAVVDKTFLAFQYHKSMVAGILALTDKLQTGLVIGLGGGGLVNFLQTVLPSLQLNVIELDESIVKIAETCFGLDTTLGDRQVRVLVGDGLSVQCTDNPSEKDDHSSILLFEPESLDFIAIDVDSKDKTVGMSCPPAAFVDVSYLCRLESILSSMGLLVINVSARDPKVLEMVKQHVANLFESVFECGGDEEGEDVNVVLFAVKGEMSLLPGMELMEKMQSATGGVLDATSSWQTSMNELECSIAGIVDVRREEAAPVRKNKKKTRKKGKRR